MIRSLLKVTCIKHVQKFVIFRKLCPSCSYCIFNACFSKQWDFMNLNWLLVDIIVCVYVYTFVCLFCKRSSYLGSCIIMYVVSCLIYQGISVLEHSRKRFNLQFCWRSVHTKILLMITYSTGFMKVKHWGKGLLIHCILF